MLDFGFGIGGGEILLVAVVAIIVIGPKDLPKVLRALGRTMANLRSMGSEFQRHLDDAMKDSGLDEVRREVSGLQQLASAEMNRQSENFLKAQQEVAASLDPEPVMALPTPPVEAQALEAPVKKPASKKAPAKKAVAKKAVAKKAAKSPARKKKPAAKKVRA